MVNKKRASTAPRIFSPSIGRQTGNKLYIYVYMYICICIYVYMYIYIYIPPLNTLVHRY